MLQNLDRIVGYEPKILDAGVASRDQAMPDSRFMHLDPDKVCIRVLGGLLNQCVTIAKPDLEGVLCIPAEQAIDIKRLNGVLETKIRPQLLERLAL